MVGDDEDDGDDVGDDDDEGDEDVDDADGDADGRVGSGVGVRKEWEIFQMVIPKRIGLLGRMWALAKAIACSWSS